MKYTKLRLRTNVVSYNYNTYGKAGEIVQLICQNHDPVWIVENRIGERYPVHRDKVDIIYELS